ncbi:UNVERIFIED_CONTAM: Gamma-cadinene synthase [Sesamum calycinum]|uniref:Gamma-cadinene synthase n=1 Tax=Sesamum calycinum TaxID=2727403 RepID=A0AAW2JTE6_9LAMI
MAPAMTVVDDSLPSLPGKDVRPPITSYSPSMWGDAFTSFSLDDKVQEKYAESIQELKHQVRSMLMSEGSTTIERLILVDTIERLGVGYHFEQEIEDQLEKSSFPSLKIRSCRTTMTCSLLHFNFVCSGNIAILSLAWWNELDLISKLPYARDRLVEGYFWGTAFRFQPQHSYARIAITKSVLMLTIMDDTYDNYATLEEADLFTEILEKLTTDIRSGSWETDATYEEYMVNTVVTSCIYVLLTVGIPGLKSASKEAIDWVMSEPNKALIASTRVCRHADDIGSDE